MGGTVLGPSLAKLQHGRHERNMSDHKFEFCGITLSARPSGALWWEAAGVLCVSDLHLGKSERIARRLGQMLPPYEAIETLGRLSDEIAATNPKTVVCLGDSFDDLAAGAVVADELSAVLLRLQAGRRWIWIEGNHDPGPVEIGGETLFEHRTGPVVYRHIAQADPQGEVSGHYHPKVSLPIGGRIVRRAAFLYDKQRIILPAFGTYTGGLSTQVAALGNLMAPKAVAVLTGQKAYPVPMPR